MPVRLVGRLVVVLLVDAVALLGLAWILPGFTIDDPWSALVLAAVLGVANAVVWPFLLRFALPFTVMTLGLGALVVNGVFLLGSAAVLDNVHIGGLFEAVVVVLGLSLVTMLFGGVLALDRGDLWFRHIVRRQLRRSQLARHTDVPGFLFLEIDGLAHNVLRRALRDGNAPFLARWIHDDGYKLHGWETHWSSQTGACQAGLLHGDDHDMPAFRWWEKDLGRAIVTNHPRDAKEIERRHSNGRGLLHDDGASRANILSGDADALDADHEHRARSQARRAGWGRTTSRTSLRPTGSRARCCARWARSPWSAGRRSSRCGATCARGCTAAGATPACARSARSSNSTCRWPR